MPDRQKRLLLSVCGVAALGCALTALVAAALPLWVRGSVLCRTGAELVNATGPELQQFLGELQYGLFHGTRTKQCGLGGRRDRFRVFPDLLSTVPVPLHVSVVFFCAVAAIFSCVAAIFFFFNAFGRPYETLQGPLGLYLWTCICGGSSFLVLVLFCCELKLHRLSERISNFGEENLVFQTFSEDLDRSFWLFLLVFLLQGLNAALTRLATGARLPFQNQNKTELDGGANDLMY
ncbi:clarin-1 [Cololabis saira]|uniref:clarin-1 n=1 Tax=Cololabis saira TaxID=129043 RepID=UPI002AD39309|nr:clarin-1 [Cololabis saira]